MTVDLRKMLGESVGDVGITSDNDKFSLSMGIGEITTKVKSDATLRQKLNQYLGPQKTQLLDAINQELLEPAIAKLKTVGQKMTLPISDDEWELLRQVRQRKKVSGNDGYQTLIRSRLVFEYRNEGESWFDINPILAEARELQG